MVFAGQHIKCTFEFIGVSWPVVWRYLHTDKHDIGACRLAGLYHRCEIRTHLLNFDTTQAIVATQLDDDNRRLVAGQRPRKSRAATARRITGYAGIHDLVFVTLRGQSLAKQVNPAFIGPETIPGAQAVAQHDYLRRFGR